MVVATAVGAVGAADSTTALVKTVETEGGGKLLTPALYLLLPLLLLLSAALLQTW